MNVIKVSIEMGNYAHVVNYVAKAEQTPDLSDKVVVAKLKVCAGLANLENRKYKLAARKLLETTFDLSTNFSEVVAPQDVAIYGGLCALATFDRSELKKRVIDNAVFRTFLELTPEVRELINDFYASNYASCLRYLDKLKPNLLLDIHLHEHVESLYQRIRNKALVQYFSPFISIDLNTMAAAFNTTVSGLEKELSKLIMENAIQARIDSHNKRLYARDVDQRSATFDKTLAMGDEYQENTKALLLRLNLLRNDVIVKPPRRDDREKK
jgi:COP9 signalosome complex subunit 1